MYVRIGYLKCKQYKENFVNWICFVGYALVENNNTPSLLHANIHAQHSPFARMQKVPTFTVTLFIRRRDARRIASSNRVVTCWLLIPLPPSPLPLLTSLLSNLLQLPFRSP